MFISPVNRIALFSALLCGILFVRHAQAEELLQSEAEGYLKDNSDPKADSHWARAFHQRALQAVNDNDSIPSEERYAYDKVFEFFFDKKNHFEESSANPLSKKDKIEVARWYLLFSNNGWRLPARIGTLLTKSNYERYVASK